MGRRSVTLWSFVLLAGGLAAPLRAADVHVVAPGTDTAVVQALIDAAGNGDIVLIQPGTTLGTLAIDGKGVGLVGDGSPRPRIRSLVVSNVPAGSTVSLRGLDIRYPGSGGLIFVAPVKAVTVTDCEGGVLIEDCVLSGGPVNAPFPGTYPALHVDGSESVSVTNSELTGGDGWSSGSCDIVGSPTPGLPALSVLNGNATVSSSTLTGGAGGNGFNCFGAPGGPGVRALGFAHVIVSGCDVDGGVGGIMQFPPSGPGAPGPGVETNLGVVLWRVDSTIHGAPPIDQPTGGVVVDFDMVGSEARSFTVTAPLRENQGGSLDFEGKQGDMVAIMWSFTTSWFEILGNRNAFIPGFAPVLGGPIILGPNPAADGAWSIPIKGPGLPPGIEGQYAVMQAFVQDPVSFEIVLTGTTTYVLVDDAF